MMNPPGENPLKIHQFNHGMRSPAPPRQCQRLRRRLALPPEIAPLPCDPLGQRCGEAARRSPLALAQAGKHGFFRVFTMIKWNDMECLWGYHGI